MPQYCRTVHVALLKNSINQFRSVEQSRQQALRAYCSNIYTVFKVLEAHIYISTGNGRFLRLPSTKNNELFEFNHDEPVKPDEKPEEDELALLNLFNVANNDRHLRYLLRKYRKI